MPRAKIYNCIKCNKKIRKSQTGLCINCFIIQPKNENHKRKISESNRGKHNYPRLKGIENPLYKLENHKKINCLKCKKELSIRAKTGMCAPCANFGKKFTEERKKNISKALTGRIGFNRGRPRPEFSGENNPNWKGGISNADAIIRQSLEYRSWRLGVFERDDYICQFPNCGQRGGKLEANHIKLFSEYPELRLDISNGITLCKLHHRNIRQKEKEYEILFIEINKLKEMRICQPLL